jgi:uncharacterized protein (DUF433 family)
VDAPHVAARSRLPAVQRVALKHAPWYSFAVRGWNIVAALDWSQCPAVESVPDRLGGAWVFRNTRMPVSAVFENLEAGASIDDIVAQFDVTREQVNAVLEFAARSLDAPPLAPGSSPVDAHSV